MAAGQNPRPAPKRKRRPTAGKRRGTGQNRNHPCFKRPAIPLRLLPVLLGHRRKEKRSMAHPPPRKRQRTACRQPARRSRPRTARRRRPGRTPAPALRRPHPRRRTTRHLCRPLQQHPAQHLCLPARRPAFRRPSENPSSLRNRERKPNRNAAPQLAALDKRRPRRHRMAGRRTPFGSRANPPPQRHRIPRRRLPAAPFQLHPPHQLHRAHPPPRPRPGPAR